MCFWWETDGARQENSSRLNLLTTERCVCLCEGAAGKLKRRLKKRKSVVVGTRVYAYERGGEWKNTCARTHTLARTLRKC